MALPPPTGVPPAALPPPPARPPGSETRTILTVVLIVVIAVAVVAIVAVVVLGNFLRAATRPPVVALSAVAVANGNASFSVEATTIPTSCLDFTVRLTVGSATTGDTPLGCTGAPVSLTVGGRTYLVTWTDADASGTVSVDDRFAVTGNGVPLPVNQSFVFYLDWTGVGSPSFSGVTNWST